MSTIKSSTTSTTAYSVVADTTGTLVLQTGATPTTAVTIGTDQSVTFAQGANLPNTFGFKNRIINGAMMIDQRNAGASVTIGTGNNYGVDRFFGQGSVTSKFTAQQSSTAPAGFSNSWLLTSSAATSVGASDYYYISQPIEGLNCADFGWGTANAQTVTLSFWVRSSLTGTFSGGFTNSGATRSYVFSYTISAANTWEQKTITVAGDTSGTWLTTNGIGVSVRFALGAGSNFTASAGSWVGSNSLGATGTTQWISTSGATFYITGVQLEKGSTATSFDYRPYGTELQLCQRYCIVQSAESKNFAVFTSMIGIAQSGGTQIGGPVQFPQQMRSAPTLTPSGAFRVSAYNTVFSAAANVPSIESARATTTGAEWTLLGLSGMTAGNTYYLQDQGSGTAKLVYSAEL